jgi:hypothetical protein
VPCAQRRFFTSTARLILRWIQAQGQKIALHADDAFTTDKGDLSYVMTCAGTTNLSELLVVNVGSHNSHWCVLWSRTEPYKASDSLVSVFIAPRQYHYVLALATTRALCAVCSHPNVWKSCASRPLPSHPRPPVARAALGHCRSRGWGVAIPT